MTHAFIFFTEQTITIYCFNKREKSKMIIANTYICKHPVHSYAYLLNKMPQGYTLHNFQRPVNNLNDILTEFLTSILRLTSFRFTSPSI